MLTDPEHQLARLIKVRQRTYSTVLLAAIMGALAGMTATMVAELWAGVFALIFCLWIAGGIRDVLLTGVSEIMSEPPTGETAEVVKLKVVPKDESPQ